MVSIVALRRLGSIIPRIRTWRRAECIKRNFRLPALSPLKTFYAETENPVIYSIIQEKQECVSSLMRIADPLPVDATDFEKVVSQDWSAESPTKVYEAFALLSNYAQQHGRLITEECFDNICDAVKVKCEEMADEQLLGLLASLSRWPATPDCKSRNFDLWMAVDRAGLKRVKAWTRPALLLFADHLYRLRVVRPSRFMTASLRKLCRKPTRLGLAHLVQTLFYVNACRRLDTVAEAFEVEHALEQHVEALTLDDLTVVAAGYFKSERRIRSERLLARIAELVGEHAATADNVKLSALLKVMRYSTPLSMMDQLYVMMGRMVPHVDRFSIMCCTHAVLAGTNAQVLHEGLVLRVAERFVRDACDARAKDLERVALALGMFGVQPFAQQPGGGVVDALLRELASPARQLEMDEYDRCLPRALQFLSLLRIFPVDLIERVLHPEAVAKVYGKTPYGYGLELLILDIALSLECPEYTGPRLSPKARHIIANRFRTRLPTAEALERGAFTDKLLGQVWMAALEVAGHQQHAVPRHVLPHVARASVVVRVDPALSGAGSLHFLPLPQWLLELRPGGEPRPAPNDGSVYVALLAAGWNNYVHGDGGGRFVGVFAATLRHLAILGYRPVVVPWEEWSKTLSSNRPEFLRQLLRDELSQENGSAAAARATPTSNTL